MWVCVYCMQVCTKMQQLGGWQLSRQVRTTPQISRSHTHQPAATAIATRPLSQPQVSGPITKAAAAAVTRLPHHTEEDAVILTERGTGRNEIDKRRSGWLYTKQKPR
mmetsp:Transcript_7448/g.18186  ORF Transcript_7448/g.18186 Transcript_7448/m.18186 type:complete len:107 (-) Transcript_7448:130-450(-)